MIENGRIPRYNRESTLDNLLERHMRILRLSLLLILFLAIGQIQAQKLTQARFEKLHREIRPEKDAAWKSIPWKISLLEAQNLASKERKPIFIWAMDGHPLGCT